MPEKLSNDDRGCLGCLGIIGFLVACGLIGSYFECSPLALGIGILLISLLFIAASWKG